MIIAVAKSVSGTQIRLTDERWQHITMSHLEIDPKDYKNILDAVENPDFVLEGSAGELLAVQKQSRKRVWSVVAYKEVYKADGFILTAYITTDKTWLLKRRIIWNKQ
jgi:hypothetical protein